jgi:RNase adaptor protein for sRNA GlmZ degradation
VMSDMITDMSLVYITGAPGSGKSTILRQLIERGHTAYGTDEHSISQWVDRKTGKVSNPPGGFDLHDWYKANEWTLNPQKILALREEANKAGKITYLLGVAAGLEVVQQYFNQLLVLTADDATLKRRIDERADNNFGKTPHELQIILEWQTKHVPGYKKQGAKAIDTSHLTPGEVVDRIIEVTER